MKIVHISDTHGRYPGVLPAGDVLVHSGDAVLYGQLAEYPEFANWISGHGFKHILVIPGNHDIAIAQQERAVRDILSVKGITLLVHSGCDISGIAFWGSPWTPRYRDWVFMAETSRLRELWAQIPPDIDVLVTHGPPRGVLDIAGTEHIGCPELLNRVLAIKPRVHLFGHCHPTYGIHYLGPTVCYNSALVDDWLTFKHDAQILEVTK